MQHEQRGLAHLGLFEQGDEGRVGEVIRTAEGPRRRHDVEGLLGTPLHAALHRRRARHGEQPRGDEGVPRGVGAHRGDELPREDRVLRALAEVEFHAEAIGETA